jgi:hypothetical protein
LKFLPFLFLLLQRGRLGNQGQKLLIEPLDLRERRGGLEKVEEICSPLELLLGREREGF